jgi:kumamolisin
LGASARTCTSVLAIAAALGTSAAAMAAVPVASDFRSAPANASRIGPTASNQNVNLAIILPSRNQASLASFISHVTTPGDPQFRHFLTPLQFAAQYGAKSADYAEIVAWAKARGLAVGEEYSAHMVVPVSGTVSAVEAAFQVHFADYKDAKGKVFYAADRAAVVPEAVASKITSVIGFNNAVGFAPLARRLPAGTKTKAPGTGPLGGFSAADLRTAYSVPPPPHGEPGETLAVFEQGGFDPDDVATYLTANGLKKKAVIVRGVNGYGGAINNPNVELEAVLDIDMEIGLNPKLKQVLVYEDGTDPFGLALVNGFAAIASDNKAQTISVSYGTDEALQDPTDIQAENTVLQQEAAQGQAVLVSAGDDGAYGREGGSLNVEDPASQPLVTAVGGTTLLTGPGQAYIHEDVWNDLASYLGATGGGVSAVWPIPAWQTYPAALGGGPVATRNGGSATNRNVPDVTAVGDPYTGVAVYSALNGGWLVIGGTSVSSPVWAGFASVVNATSKAFGFGQLGFFNPAVYIAAPTYGGFNDILDGTNGDAQLYGDNGIPGYTAGYLYDNTSGYGSPEPYTLGYLAFLPAFVNNTNPPPTPNGVKAVAGSTEVTLTWTPSSGASGYLVDATNLKDFGQRLPVIVTQDHRAKIQGLAPGTNYGLQVLAVSPTGWSSTFVFVSTTTN